MGKYKKFNRKQLNLKPLAQRVNDLEAEIILELGDGSHMDSDALDSVASRLLSARKAGASVIMMMGGHVLRSGVQRYIIDMMERGLISLLAGNGSVIIHDFEFAMAGATTESVARYIQTGEFGLWSDTGRLNEIINSTYLEDPDSGLGEAVGKHIEESDYPRKDVSVLAAAYRLGIPFTVHVGIGYDIIHEHPNFDGAATGALSYNDFLTFASVVQGLEGGVLMSFGSAVMAPEVFLKALSMARNVKGGGGIRDFFTLVCDIVDLPPDTNVEPIRTKPAYYFRPFKTLLVRTVADGGQSRYVRGRHEETVPGLWASLRKLEGTVNG